MFLVKNCLVAVRSHLRARQAETSAGAPYLLIITLLPGEWLANEQTHHKKL
jgi:hypothetical protein